MKAVIQDQYGGPEVLRISEVSVPQPKEGEILISIKAAAVNRTDCANLRAKPFIMRFTNGLLKPRKKIPGTAFSGIVTATGRGVEKFLEGDRVFGFDDSGLCSFAEYLVIPARKAIAHIPEGIPFDQAAAGIEGFHYAWNFLNKVPLSEGQHVLVNGGTGAIGSATIQLLAARNLTITAVGPGKHRDLMKAMGATELIDYETQDFTQTTTRFDYVFDTVGKSSYGKCNPLIKAGGSYISSELGKGAQNLFLALLTSLTGSKKVRFPLPLHPLRSAQHMAYMMAEKTFIPLIDRTYPLQSVAEAFRYVESGQKVGNVVLIP